MKRRKKTILFVVLALLTVGSVYLFLRDTDRPVVRLNRETKAVSVSDSMPLVKSSANLYFADRANVFLIAKSRSLLHPGTPVAFGKGIIESLTEGPQEELMPTIPRGTVLRALYIRDDGTAFVDMSKAISDNHPGGCKSELLTIFSIVNSLVLNISEITSVKILVGGQEAETLAGHIDIRFPFKANMLLVR
jgi:hypothetical protein